MHILAIHGPALARGACMARWAFQANALRRNAFFFETDETLGTPSMSASPGRAFTTNALLVLIAAGVVARRGNAGAIVDVAYFIVITGSVWTIDRNTEAVCGASSARWTLSSNTEGRQAKV